MTAAPAQASSEPAPQVKSSTTSGNTSTLTFTDGATFSSTPTAGAKRRAGSFTWNAHYDNVVFSRDWTTGATGRIYVNISRISDCGPYTHTLKLRQKTTIGWRYYGNPRDVSCSGGSYNWPDAPRDTYEFQLEEKGSSGDSYFNHDASGTVSYN